MSNTLRCCVATFAVAIAAIGPSTIAVERATKKVEVTSQDNGAVLVKDTKAHVLQEVSPTGRKAPTPATKRTFIEVGIFTSEELAPKAKVNITDREVLTAIGMSEGGVLNTGAPVSAARGSVESVDDSAIITLAPKDADKAQSFGETVKGGDLYYAQNGQVYQYVGTLD